MDKKFLTQLTSNLYQLTLLFPKKEPLRFKMRELADEILADLISIDSITGNPQIKLKEDRVRQILENLEILDNFFEVAKSQNWVSPSDILEIQAKYFRIKEEIKRLEKPEEKKAKTIKKEAQASSVSLLLPPVRKEKNSRQERILEILKEKGKIQVWQLKEILPEMSKRTLRRDFENLVKHGLIERSGEKNDTFYQLKEAKQ